MPIDKTVQISENYVRIIQENSKAASFTHSALIGTIALAAIGIGIFGTLALYANLSHSSLGWIHSNSIGLTGSSVLIGTSGAISLLGLAVHAIIRHRQTKKLLQIIDPERAANMMQGLNRSTFLNYRVENNAAAYQNEIGDRVYYIVIRRGTPFQLYIFTDVEQRNALLNRIG